jgi:hypothetical protein
MTTVDCVKGSYRFLPGIAPFSSGAIAMPGSHVVHATLRRPIPWRKGFELIDAHLAEHKRPRAALCAIELRIPAALTPDGFDGFNAGYQALLKEWDVLVDGENPIARTNVAPVVGAPGEASLYGFAYTAPEDKSTARGRQGSTDPATPTFVVAGSGETRRNERGVAELVRSGESTPDAMREKAAYVLGVMRDRLHGLGASFTHVTAINVYTAHPIEPFLADTILKNVGPAAIHGVTWHLSHPPVVDIEFEMDMRGTQRRIWL